MTNGKRILCLEDDATTRVIYVSGLKLVAETVAVVDGSAGLAKLQEDPCGYGLIFTDNNMPPGMDGLEFLAQALDYTIPKVMISMPISTDRLELHCRIRELGGIGLIMKPTRLSFLRNVAQELLQDGISPTYEAYARENRFVL